MQASVLPLAVAATHALTFVAVPDRETAHHCRPGNQGARAL
jgi:hypothetical protein